MTGWKFSKLVGCFLSGLVLADFLNAGECFGRELGGKKEKTINRGEGQGERISSRARPFGPGEKIVFRIIYLAMPAGIFTMEVDEMTEFQGVSVYHFIAKAQSSMIFSLFYRVRDKVESFVDAETFMPLRFEQHLREGPRYRSDKITIFDRSRNLAKVGSKEVPIPSDVQDVLSVFYYLRALPLEVGKSEFLNVNTGEKNYRIELKVLRKETMRKWGRSVETIVVQPILKDIKRGGIFKEKRDVFIWLTDDEKRIPVFITAKLVVGQLSFVLVDHEEGKNKWQDLK